MVLNFKKNKYINHKKGMTYVELIVVLSIFSIMSSVLIFNYRDFQARIDIKNLTSDIALKIVQAQKESMNGRLILQAQTGWVPSYGVYFDISNVSNNINPKSFAYFADFDKNYMCYDCQNSLVTSGGEFLEKLNINNNNFVNSINVVGSGNCSTPVNAVSFVFSRTSSGPMITTYPDNLGCVIEHVDINVLSSVSDQAGSTILVYSSGRIQVN